MRIHHLDSYNRIEREREIVAATKQQYDLPKLVNKPISVGIVPFKLLKERDKPSVWNGNTQTENIFKVNLQKLVEIKKF